MNNYATLSTCWSNVTREPSIPLQKESEVYNSIVIGTEGNGEWGEKVIRYILEKAHPNQNIIFSNENTCDFIIKGPFKYEKLWNSDPKKYIYWSGEPYSKKFYR